MLKYSDLHMILRLPLPNFGKKLDVYSLEGVRRFLD